MVYNALECADFDYYALFVLCLLYAMSHNKGKSVLLCEGDQGLLLRPLRSAHGITFQPSPPFPPWLCPPES